MELGSSDCPRPPAAGLLPSRGWFEVGHLADGSHELQLRPGAEILARREADLDGGLLDIGRWLIEGRDRRGRRARRTPRGNAGLRSSPMSREPGAPDDVVDVRDLGVTFGRGRNAVAALRGIELRCSPGEIVGVLGPNGSGKTTLFRVLVGELPASAGRVTVLGGPPGDPARIPRIGYQPEGPLPFPRLSGRAFLRQIAALIGMPGPAARTRADELLERIGLAHAALRAHGGYSTGMAKRLALAGALLTRPELLLLDEPTAGLDAEGSATVLDVLREAAGSGATVLIASHHLQEVETVCGRVVVLYRGRVCREGPLADVLAGHDDQLTVHGLPTTARPTVEAAVTAAGGAVRGWRPSRRHLFELFRELASEDPDHHAR